MIGLSDALKIAASMFKTVLQSGAIFRCEA